MDDDEIREALRPHRHAMDGGWCYVDSAHLDPSLDRSEIRAWVLRQEGGDAKPLPVTQSSGMRPGRLSAPASGHDPASERYVFPCSALDGD